MLVKQEINPLFETSGVEKVCFISSDKHDKEGVEAVICGDKFFNFCSLETAKKYLESLQKNADGIQFYFEDLNLDKLFKKIKYQPVTKTNLDEMTIYCGYSPYYQSCVMLQNKKVNVQVAVMDGEVVVGFPMILTGY